MPNPTPRTATARVLPRLAEPIVESGLLSGLRQRLDLARFLLTGCGSVDEGYALTVLRNLEGRHPRHCPVCGFVGRFQPFGLPPRLEAKCPYCGSLERQRLLAYIDREHDLFKDSKSLLHFAPEPLISDVLRASCEHYVSADLVDPAADIRLDIEAMEVPDESFDTVLCCHVLEHVDDRKALAEIRRVLKPGGRLVTMVPIAEGCAATYENPDIRDPARRQLHFGQWDHLRLYGADFRDRLRAAGFRAREYTAEGEEAVRYAFRMGEKVFVAEKPAVESLSAKDDGARREEARPDAPSPDAGAVESPPQEPTI